MSSHPRRNKTKQLSASSMSKDRMTDDEQSIPMPSRQGHLNEHTDFAGDPALIFDDLPQPFRRINKVLESIFDQAWTMIEKREKQRQIDQSKFVSAQHTSSTLIQTPLPVSLIGSHVSGTLCFFHSTENEQHYLICYDSQVDQIINQINIDSPLKDMIVFKADPSWKDPIYYISAVDRSGYWKMFAYKNQQYYLLFTQYETEDESKRPICLMSQTGLNEEFMVVAWFGNNDSWLEVYKLPKDQWKSEITAQEQALSVNENQAEENIVNQAAESGPTLVRGQFSRPTLLFKVRAPKFTAGLNNFQQLMKNTENQANIGQGTINHFYTQQMIDGKMTLIKELMAPTTPKTDGNDRPLTVTKQEPSSPLMPILHFIPAGATATGAVSEQEQDAGSFPLCISRTQTPHTSISFAHQRRRITVNQSEMNDPHSCCSGLPALAVSWPTTNQLMIYKIAKSESKGKDAADTRPTTIWPFASRISSLAYDSKHEHLAVALESGNICIIERTTGINDLPSIQHVSSSAINGLHSLDSHANPVSGEDPTKTNGFLVLSNDGSIYHVKFQSALNDNNTNEHQNLIACFPQEQSKDASKIMRTVFLDGNPSNLFLSINELDRIYVNDGLKRKQLCEIVLSQSSKDGHDPFQIALIDQARSIIIGVPTKWTISEDEGIEQTEESRSLSVYRVPLEHFPSLEKYYPERVVPPIEETESAIETKPSKMTSSHAKKTVSAVEVDKASLIFDEKIKELFRKRQSESYERRERLRTRWNEIKLHCNPVYEQTS